jgi:hypothetical protein
VPPSSVHFNGSVNLPDAESVMREISSRIPTGVRRMVDGEPGERSYWVVYQQSKFEQVPQFQLALDDHLGSPDGAPALPGFSLVEGATPESVTWPDLGYADSYIESYELFRRLQEEGAIATDTRFQLQYPAPVEVISAFVSPEDLPRVGRQLLASYEKALFADLNKALAVIPHDRCAVQWDLAFQMEFLEGDVHPDKTNNYGLPVMDLTTWNLNAGVVGPGKSTPMELVAADTARCIDAVPADVPVGLHLCYGDYGHMHAVDPESLGLQIELLNAIAASASRTVSFCQFTVTQGQRAPEFFAPLEALRTGQGTELAFGIVPYFPDNHEPGTTAEQVRLIDAGIAASETANPEWSVSTECGLGRVTPEDLPKLLDFHRQILEEYAA